MEKNEIPKILPNAIGKKLISVEERKYVLGDYSDTEQVRFTFEDGMAVRFFCGRDGASLCCSEADLEERDLGAYGSLVAVDASNAEKYRGFIYLALRGIEYVYSEVENKYIGVKLQFCNCKNVFIVNFGDEIFIDATMPLEVIQSERLIFSS